MKISQCRFYGPAPEGYTSWLDWIHQVEDGGDITGVSIFDGSQIGLNEAISQSTRQESKSLDLNDTRMQMTKTRARKALMQMNEDLTKPLPILESAADVDLSEDSVWPLPPGVRRQ